MCPIRFEFHKKISSIWRAKFNLDRQGRIIQCDLIQRK